MHDISDFETFFLTQDRVNYHIRRRREVLLSLPSSQDGASHAIKLYRPQREVARLTAWGLGFLVARGLHRGVLRRGKPAGREPVPAWDFQYAPETVGILLGSAQHLVRRAIASYRGANGWEVAKLGIGPEARAMLRKEAAILHALADGGGNTPPCLGLHEIGEMTLLRMPYLTGNPVAGDASEGPMDLLEQWLRNAPPRAVCEFPEWQAIRSALETIPGGPEALEGLSGHSLRPVISHGDFARWNLLQRPDGTLIALDWEWGELDGMPGLDLVHYFSQDARLVRQLNSRGVIRAVEAELKKPRARDYLLQTGWGNRPIEPILACAAYKQGALHQKNPGFLDACVKEYLARQEKAVQNPETVRPPLEPAPAPAQPPTRPPASKPAAMAREAGVRISVVTPSFKQVDFLKCCAASVRDQAGDFQVEHLIHDGGSGSGFEQWAASQQGAVCVSERDDGMYDAINRGFRKASGGIIAWLNCDEQYLPGALERVARFFEAHPETDILFGDVILVDEMMTPLAYRRAVMPSLGHIRYSHLSTFSAATFVRRRVLDEGHYLKTRWKTIADAVWIAELLAAGYRGATLHEPLAAFCMLGSNLGQSTLLFEERREWERELGTTRQWRKQCHIMRYRLQRLRVGAYWLRKVRVSAYVPGSQKRLIQEKWVSGQWRAARNEAADLRSQRDGMMGGLMVRVRPARWTYVQALCLLAIAVGVDKLTAGDAVKGPLILLLSLMVLSFRSRLRDLIPVAAVYLVASWYLLSERPFDVMLVRLGTFALGAILAVFWSAGLRNLEAWIHSTVALIRRVPGPMILTDPHGKIILVNHAACAWLRGSEQSFLNQELLALTLASDGRIAKRLMMRDWEERPPDDVLGVALEHDSQSPLAKARVFVVGRGRYRFYAFTLQALDGGNS